jgi:anti-sigma F factor
MKNGINKMTLTFPSRSSNEGFARTAAAAFVAQLDPTVDELSDIKTAVSEAVTNCIVHAYKDGVGDIQMCVEIGADNMVEITVKDKGCGIEDIKKAVSERIVYLESYVSDLERQLASLETVFRNFRNAFDNAIKTLEHDTKDFSHKDMFYAVRDCVMQRYPYC